MFLCRDACKILTSRSAVTGIPSFSLSMRTFFMATISPVFLFLARYTTPYVPSPMRPAGDGGERGEIVSPVASRRSKNEWTVY
eukprot:30871-Pelagococcus_subviridis.AAC.11